MVKKDLTYKKMEKNVLSNPRRPLALTAKTATAAAFRNSKQALSTLPEFITAYNTKKRFTLVNLYKYSLIYSNKSMNNKYKNTCKRTGVP